MEILFTREPKNPFILESHLGEHNTFEIPLEGENAATPSNLFKAYKFYSHLEQHIVCLLKIKSLTTLYGMLTELELNLKLPGTWGPGGILRPCSGQNSF